MRVITGGASLIIILFCSFIGAISINFVGRYLDVENRFCTQEHRVVQTVSSNWEDLISRFPDYSVVLVTSFAMTAPDGREFIVEADWEHPAGTPALLYVNVGTDNDGLRGSEGFLFLLPGQQIPQFWYDHYWITHLDTNTFCYVIRGF